MNKELESYFSEYLNNNKEKYCDAIYIITILEDILHMSLYDIKEKIANSNVTVTGEQIKAYLDELFEMEEPEVKKRIQDRENQPIVHKPIDLVHLSDLDIEKMSLKFDDELVQDRYYFEPYTLQYYKKYISIIKSKTLLLLSIIEKIGTNDYSSVKSMLNDLDIEIMDGKISREDIIRLIEPMVYNFYRLQERAQRGNDLNTYLTEKISEVSLFKSDISEFELYPTIEIQVRNLYYDDIPGNVRLSERQEETLKEERSKMLKKNANMIVDLFD